MCVSVYEKLVRSKVDTFTFRGIRGRDQLRHSICTFHG